MESSKQAQGIALPDTLAQEFSDIIDYVLERTAAAGADQAEASVGQDVGVSVSARMRDIETIEYQNDRDMYVTVYRDQCKGSVSTSDFSKQAIDDAIEKALYIATQTGADPASGLADADRMATDFPDLNLDHAWSINVDEMRELALATEAAALDADKQISNSEGAAVNTNRSFGIYGNSHGFKAGQQKSRHSISCAVIAGSGDNMERDYEYTSNRNPDLLMDASEVGRRAAQSVLARMSPKKIKTQSAPVLFRADVARGIFGHLLGAISGGSQYRKASFLLDAVGETLFPDFVSLREAPFIKGAPASSAFDVEGVATEERDIVKAGVLQSLILSSYSARRLGLETTGNAGGVHNALVASTGGDMLSLASEMQEGLLVTEMMGQGVNMVTGDYSRGAAGFWVENGEIAYPVSEITIAGNLREMFLGIQAIGDDVDARGALQCGSVLIDSMTIAGS
ncbi:MAG: metalloprotease PmbA [Woeseiaceae bacterium]